MKQFIFYAENPSSSALTETPGAIESALQSIPIVAGRANRAARGLLDDGGWVGSSRITRRARLGIADSRLTTVAWLYEYGDPPADWTAQQKADHDRLLRGYIQTNADEALKRISADWRPSQIIAYNPAVHGSRDWWALGEASRTRTRDAFDLNQQLGSNATVENPTGPDSVGPPPSLDPTQVIGGIGTIQTAVSGLKTVGWIAAGGVALYFAWPFLMGLRTFAPKPRARTSPHIRAVMRQR